MNNVIVLGSGGHAGLLLEILKKNKFVKILGVTSIDKTESFKDTPILGSDDILEEICKRNVQLVNGIGSVGKGNSKRDIYLRMKNQGFTFLSIVHPGVNVASNIVLEEGVQVMAGAIIQNNVTLHENVLINSGVIIDHDCTVGAHTHIAPGVTVSGNVNISSNVHVGTGANIIQGISIGKDSVVGAGVTVLKDVPENSFLRAVDNPVWG